MSEEKFHGVPRSKIPWCPTIDREKCVGCGKCADFCKHGVYELEEKAGKKRSVVKSPNNCMCTATVAMEYVPSALLVTHQK